jgi:hypothetical protein
LLKSQKNPTCGAIETVQDASINDRKARSENLTIASNIKGKEAPE